MSIDWEWYERLLAAKERAAELEKRLAETRLTLENRYRWLADRQKAGIPQTGPKRAVSVDGEKHDLQISKKSSSQ